MTRAWSSGWARRRYGWGQFLRLAALALTVPSEHGCVHAKRGWGQRMPGDAKRPQCKGQLACQGNATAFRRRIRTAAAFAQTTASNRGNMDDVPAPLPFMAGTTA